MKFIDNGNGRGQVVSTNSFGETVCTSLSPIIQDYAPYGIINNQIFVTFSAGGGSVLPTSDGNEIDLSIGTGVGDYAVIRSKRVMKYRSGFDMISRMNAIFDPNAVANSLQFVGVGSSDCDLYFCMNGDEFGVRRSTDGKLEIWKLTISAAASGAETATVTLNSVVFNINLTNAGGDISFTAHEVEVGTTYTGWSIEHIDDDVIFVGGDAGPRPGTYSFTSSGTAAGTFSQLKAGQALTTTFIPRSQWNGTSQMKTAVNPFKRNMYEITYSWYGSGNINFSVMNPSTGGYDIVHSMSFSNLTTDLSLSEPNMYLQRGVASLGSTTALSIRTAGSFGAIYGSFAPELGPRYSASVEKAITGGTEAVLLGIKNRISIGGFPNQSEIFLDVISVSNDSVRANLIKIIKNPTTLSADTTSDFTDFQYIDEANSIAIADTTTLTYSGGIVLFQKVVGRDSSESFELLDKKIFLAKEDVVIITSEPAANADVIASISFIDDL